MKKPIVIAFLARAGSGKTTAADYLVRQHGAVKISFAQPLKELAKHLLDFSDEQVFGKHKETLDSRYGFTPREFLQKLGNGARNFIDNRVWIRALITAAQRQHTEGNKLLVVDDCRYKNEAEEIWLSTLIEGFVVKLDCPNRVSSADPNHPSEKEVDEVPGEHLAATIYNDPALGVDYLEDQVEKFLEDWGILNMLKGGSK